MATLDSVHINITTSFDVEAFNRAISACRISAEDFANSLRALMSNTNYDPPKGFKLLVEESGAVFIPKERIRKLWL